MLTNPCNYDVEKIVEHGLLDKEGKESVFLKFSTNGGEFTWFGSLKGLQPGKDKSARQITFETMSKLGWDGDIDKFASNLATFSVPAGTRIEVADDEYAPGKVSVGKVVKVLVPGFGMKKMDGNKAKGLLASMKADITKAKETVESQAEIPF
jgi:hypothetical protein